MSLKDDKQQNIQIELDFSSTPAGEAREAGREGTESSGAAGEPESHAIDGGSTLTGKPKGRIAAGEGQSG